MLKFFLFGLFAMLMAVVSRGADYAPSEETIAANLPGRSIGGTEFLSATRFNWSGETGNWSYTRVSGNVGLIVQTYDDGGNNPNAYREETRFTFLTETSGTYEYTEYVAGSIDFSTDGIFDYSWLAGTSGPERWVPAGWVYVSWPYMDAGSWHYFLVSAESVQWRVDLGNGEWETFDAATGWHYFAWPYAYSPDRSAWFWYDTASTQWVYDFESAIWSTLGQ